MDTLSNIKLIIHEGSKGEYHINMNFFENIESINFKKDIIKIKEYHHVSIENSGDAKLYFDCFDVLEDRMLEKDEKGIKFLSNGRINLIDNQKINNTLVPGYYLFKLKDKKEYFSVIEIEPKNLDYVEWKKLYTEVDNFINGLSRSLLNKTHAKMVKSRNNSNIYEKINYLIENYAKLILSLNAIKNNPRQIVSKKYNWINKNTASLIDKNSIKKQGKSPHMKDFLYSYKRKIDYNISENIWLKTKLIFLLSEINKIQLALNNINFEESIYKNINIRNDRITYNISSTSQKVSSIKKNIINLLEEEWLYYIKENLSTKPSKGALMNHNYNIIYKWVREFRKTELSVVFSKIIQNSWKRTDELYEIWCLIYLITSLIEKGYSPINGWIYSEEPELELYEGTIIKLKKDKITLNIHYNSIIKAKSNETSIEHPLYTKASNNKPDIRIDIFVCEIYLKSIPIDAKYRRLKNITGKKIGSLEQLLAYKDRPNSKFHLQGAKSYKRKNHRIINKVIVLFPRDEKNSKTTSNLKEEFGIEFYELSPDLINSSFIEMIENEINEMIEVYEDTYNR